MFSDRDAGGADHVHHLGGQVESLFAAIDSCTLGSKSCTPIEARVMPISNQRDPPPVDPGAVDLGRVDLDRGTGCRRTKGRNSRKAAPRSAIRSGANSVGVAAAPPCGSG